MPWNVRFNQVIDPATNTNNTAMVDIAFVATHTDGRIVNRVASSTKWTTSGATVFAENLVAELVQKDQQKAANDALLPGFKSYIQTNPLLATG